MRIPAVILALLAAPALPALADGGVTVPLADVSGLSAPQAEELLAALVQANVVSSNCPDYAVTDGEWALIVGSADRLAYEVLGLDAGAYDDRFYGPAFASLDDPATCAADGPAVRGLIDLLVDMGGGTNPETVKG